MFFVSIIFLTILIPAIQSSKPTLKLTFTPDEKYYTEGHVVEILCELLNPSDHTESPQLWHVDIKSGRRTPISRSLLNAPPDDALDVFRQNGNKRLKYVKKIIYVEPGWPLQENAKTTLKCTADYFYPYVSYQIFRDHHKLNDDGKAVIPNSNTIPQEFSWEITVTPTFEWHNTTLKCNSERHAIKTLQVLFTPRFIRCDKKQRVNTTNEQSTIECSYAGNPKPELIWLRQTDRYPITKDDGIIIETIDQHHGIYKSIVTFNRHALTTISDGKQLRKTEDNYYQKLLNDGFIVQLKHNNEIKDTCRITIVDGDKQSKSKIFRKFNRKKHNHKQFKVHQ
ncbi:unnamed protein product [Adineta steineri]|uniref:Ig-like domain-containing protein n=1 Tax=Adineta steineri TaxID=433720 RepID=A0A813ZGU1_9BILA|nr:unnamed protein product [Adineta steineri]CAF3866628.1 unnamed protein product [Adineta steineri]